MPNRGIWAPDQRWTVMGFGSEDDMMAGFELPELGDGIPDELRARLDRIERCLRLSFVEYELVDIVADYAVVTAELAFVLRYKRSRGDIPGRHMKLLKMIEWAEKEGLLSGLEKKAHFLRTYRNRNVHPQWDSYGGIAIATVPKFVFEVVNSLFAVDGKSALDEGAGSCARG